MWEMRAERSKLCLITQPCSLLFSFSQPPCQNIIVWLKSVFLRPTLWLALAFWFLFQQLIVSRFRRQIHFCYSCVANSHRADATVVIRFTFEKRCLSISSQTDNCWHFNLDTVINNNNTNHYTKSHCIMLWLDLCKLLELMCNVLLMLKMSVQ